MPISISTYDGQSSESMTRLANDIGEALSSAAASYVDEDDGLRHGETGPLRIDPIDDLIGIDPSVHRQINAALAAGLKHIMLYGPPGTGKTTIAQRLAGAISERWKLVTGSSDWTSQEIVGGYHPLSDGRLMFQPGVLLEHFDKPVIFDELNRCDIDKVLGPLFTVLSGQSTTLPYLTDPSDAASPRIQILPKGIPEPPVRYAPSPSWRLIATINSIDKASLYQMSYALTRRFAWIFVPVPANTSQFVEAFAHGNKSDNDNALGTIWSEVNQIREIGAAPVIDIIRLVQAVKPEFNFAGNELTQNDAQLIGDGLEVCMMPMLDGILRDEGERLAESLCLALSTGGADFCDRIRRRLMERTV